MSEITYLLGAGASCNSMPLVENFIQRFNIFLSFLRLNNFNSKDNLLKECEQFIEEISAHLSFDTYFKKLFHQKELKLISHSKSLLLLYFIFEHLVNRQVYSGLLNVNTNSKDKKFNLDPRYDALIAGLIKPQIGKSEFYAKVNFITWNYDLNLLMAHKNFHRPNQDITAYIKEYNTSENEFKFENNISIFHMNGFINHPLINSGKSLQLEQLIELFNSLINQHYSNEHFLTTHSSSINFCWETINESSNLTLFIENAIQSIIRSSHVIIVGYSFPLYNRFYDQLLFAKQNINRTSIIIQNPDSNAALQYFRTIFNYPENTPRSKEDPIFITIDNCKSFYVPNDILSVA